MADKKKKPRDLNQLAASIVDISTDEEAALAQQKPEETGKDPAAVALGRKGGQKGGKARAEIRAWPLELSDDLTLGVIEIYDALQLVDLSLLCQRTGIYAKCIYLSG